MGKKGVTAGLYAAKVLPIISKKVSNGSCPELNFKQISQ